MQCHIGDGARALVHYKLAGVRQLVHVITRQFPRPIPASQAVLRPALETCGTCHSPDARAWRSHAHHSRVRGRRDEHRDGDDADDARRRARTEDRRRAAPSTGTPTRTCASNTSRPMRIGRRFPSSGRSTRRARPREYVVEGTKPETLAAGTTRTMDCIDCHNAAAHRISPTAEQAVNRAIAAGQISPALPFVRREAVRLLKAEYTDAGRRPPRRSSRACGRSMPRRKRRRRTQPRHRRSRRRSTLYRRNVFPAMKVTWGVYRDNLGPHDVRRAASAVTTTATKRRTGPPSAPIASIATSRSRPRRRRPS